MAKKSCKTFYTADTHFGSNKVLKLSNRPFETTEDMDNYIIKKWNNTVTNDSDIVYHLGDFGNYNTVQYLNGRIFLLLGNHEYKYCRQYFDNDVEFFRNYLLNLGFNRIYLRSIKSIDGFYCYHKPCDCNKKYFNLFGHIHDLQKTKSYGLNVGVDCNNFTPIDIKTILYFKDKINTGYKKISY